jgi:hypothetical protein
VAGASQWPGFASPLPTALEIFFTDKPIEGFGAVEIIEPE